MSELAAAAGLILFLLLVIRISVWLIGIDRAAKIFPGKKTILKDGCCGFLYINGDTRDGWIQMFNWRFCVENNLLFINPAPQIPLLWLLPCMAIPLSELTVIYSPGAWFSGGWRKAYLVEKAGIKLRLPKQIAEQIGQIKSI